MTIKFTYEQLRSLQNIHERNMSNWGDKLQAFIDSTGAERNAMNLLPDEVRFHPEYRYLRGQFEECKDSLRFVNQILNREFKTRYRKDLRDERDARRQAKLDTQNA